MVKKLILICLMGFLVSECEEGYQVSEQETGYQVSENDLDTYENNGEVVSIIVGEQIIIYGDEVAEVPITNTLQVDYICNIGSQSGNNYVITADVSNVGEVWLYINAINAGVVVRQTKTKLIISDKAINSKEISTATFYDWAAKAPSPYSWVSTGGNILTVSGVYLDMSYVDDGTCYYNLIEANGLSEALVNGDTYILKVEIKVAVVAGIRVWNGSGYGAPQFPTSDYAEYTFTFTKNVAGTAFFSIYGMGANENVSIGYIKVYNEASTITIIGNSLVAAGGDDELVKVRSIFDSMTWVGVGTTDIAPNLRESHTGKTYDWLVNHADSPFTKTGVVDIPAYYTDNGLDVPDFIYMRMGVNDAFNQGASEWTDAEKAIWLTDISELIDAFLAHNADLKIIIGLPSISENTGDGWENNYPGNQNQDNYITIIHQIWDAIIETYINYDSRVTIAYAPWGLDRDDGYPKTDDVHTNGVHPDASGYVELGQGLAFALNNLL